MPKQELKLKHPERLWVLSVEYTEGGGSEVWWPVNNPPWRLYEAGEEFEITFARSVDGKVVLMELRDEQGRHAGWDVDKCPAERSDSDDLFELCPVPCNKPETTA